MHFIKYLELIENADGVASGDMINEMIKKEKNKSAGSQSCIAMQYLAKNKKLIYEQYNAISKIEFSRRTNYNIGVIENLLNNPSVCEIIKRRCRNV